MDDSRVTWVVQSNLLDYQQLSKVCDAVRESGAKLVEASVIPFCDTFHNEEDLAKEDLSGMVIPYGSTGLCKKAAARGWKGLFFDEEIFRSDVFSRELGDLYLNGDQKIFQVKDLESALEGRDPTEVAFIRPVKDLKEFNGTVTHIEEIRRWMTASFRHDASFGPETWVAISSPKKILSESRFFVVGGKVIDGAFYRMYGQRFSGVAKPDEIEAAQEMANVWLPHETCVMDIAKTEEGLKVIEFNCFNGSGFYVNDISKIVKAVTEYAEKL